MWLTVAAWDSIFLHSNVGFIPCYWLKSDKNNPLRICFWLVSWLPELLLCVPDCLSPGVALHNGEQQTWVSLVEAWSDLHSRRIWPSAAGWMRGVRQWGWGEKGTGGDFHEADCLSRDWLRLRHGEAQGAFDHSLHTEGMNGCIRLLTLLRESKSHWGWSCCWLVNISPTPSSSPFLLVNWEYSWSSRLEIQINHWPQRIFIILSKMQHLVVSFDFHSLTQVLLGISYVVTDHCHDFKWYMIHFGFQPEPFF